MAGKTSYEAFLADVLANVPSDRRAAVEEALSLESVKAQVEAGVKRQSDYSREMDSLRARREEVESTLQEGTERITEWQNWYDTASKEYESMKGMVDMRTNEEPVASVQQGLTKDELQAELAARDRMAIAYADLLTDIKMDHRDKFHERLDTSKLVEYALKRGVPLDVAYRESVAPREDELRKADLEQQLKKAREEGAREFAANHRLPIVSGPQEQHPIDLAPTAKTNSTDRVAAAVGAWNTAVTT